MRQVIALSVAAALSCALAQSDARAQPMSDPMRPADARATEDSKGAPPGGGLQVVITSPQRKLAVINGTVVPLGSGTLAGISDSVVVLQKNGERDVLLMHPNIDKKPSRGERP